MATIECDTDQSVRDAILKIKRARKRIETVTQQKTNLANAMSGIFISSCEIEYPEPDVAHVYHVMLGRRMCGDPIVYRLSFGNPLRWVGVSHPWGVKPADIDVDDIEV